MRRADLPVPTTGIATHFVVAGDIETTVRFYSEVLGGEVVSERVRPGAPTYVRLANTWIGVNAGGGPTPDKPEVFPDVHDDANRYDSSSICASPTFRPSTTSGGEGAPSS
jgi:catechol 2,3-dioxygenase-like lactoylglutathione lyase family enzyme